MGLLLGIAYDEDGRAYAGMGADFQDYDNDGWPDIFLNALARQHYSLYRNEDGMFVYSSGATGISEITQLHSGWGARFVDFDSDGWKDIFVAQSHVMDNIEITQPELNYLEPPLMMRNNAGHFEDVSTQLGDGFKLKAVSRGVALASAVVARALGPGELRETEASVGLAPGAAYGIAVSTKAETFALAVGGEVPGGGRYARREGEPGLIALEGALIGVFWPMAFLRAAPLKHFPISPYSLKIQLTK